MQKTKVYKFKDEFCLLICATSICSNALALDVWSFLSRNKIWKICICFFLIITIWSVLWGPITLFNLWSYSTHSFTCISSNTTIACLLTWSIEDNLAPRIAKSSDWRPGCHKKWLKWRLRVFGWGKGFTLFLLLRMISYALEPWQWITIASHISSLVYFLTDLFDLIIFRMVLSL